MIENPYEARGKLVQMIRHRGAEIDADRAAARDLRQRTDLSASPVVPRPQRLLDPDMTRALEKMNLLEELYRRLPQIDCGACGSPGCKAFAEDVVQGRRVENDCVLMLQNQLRGTVSQLNELLAKMPQPKPQPPEEKP
jgi:hypothetical protein